MTFQLTANRTGRPPIPQADLESRRARYLELRERLPISDAELARRLGQHPVYVRTYRRNRVPTDATLDAMKRLVRQTARRKANFADVGIRVAAQDAT